jgi:hypothetical protein
MNGFRQTLRMVIALGFIALLAGCASAPQPHITAKVIYQHEDVAAELSSEWNR